MSIRKSLLLGVALAVLGAGSASAAVIDFTGGTAYLEGGGTGITNNSNSFWNTDYYEENGFRLDFVGDHGHVGPYYGMDPDGVYNDVIHGHWGTGSYGALTSILVTKIDGTAFDLNYFILTSNTDNGGGEDSGNEQTWIHAWGGDGSAITYSQLLPTDDWGWDDANPQIFLGPQFDNIMKFSYDVSNHVDCFGMDNFYIDEPAPNVPEPGTIVLLGTGLGGLAWLARRRRKR